MATYVDFLKCPKCNGEFILDETNIPITIYWKQKNESEETFGDLYHCQKCNHEIVVCTRAKLSSIEEELENHRKCVEKIANEWKKEGYIIQAAIKGWDPPDRITKEHLIPDVIAKKMNETIII